MKYIKIKNDGLLDIRLLSLMGGTTKANDKFKIGQWGSGLKYSMAWMLRNKLSFRVFIGNDEVSITTNKEYIRGEEFEIIYVNGEKTSVTTNMGGNAWKEWMIIREIWCNALDEGGNEIAIVDTPEGSSGNTSFYIELSVGFAKVMDDWQDYFIHDRTPIFSLNNYSIYHNKGNLRLYKQGVRIGEYSQDSVFAYNIDDATLNELREFNGSTSFNIYNCLADAPVDVIKYFLDNIKEDHFESSMDWCWSSKKLSDNWEKAIGDKYVATKSQIATLMTFKRIDLSKVIVLSKNIYEIITKTFPEKGLLKTVGNYPFFEIHNSDLSSRVMLVNSTLKSRGYYVPDNITYKFGRFEDKDIIARAVVDKREVYLSEQLNSRSDMYLASTLIEEYEHIKTGHSDHTRAFQQHFIDMYTELLLKPRKNEEENIYIGTVRDIDGCPFN